MRKCAVRLHTCRWFRVLQRLLCRSGGTNRRGVPLRSRHLRGRCDGSRPGDLGRAKRVKPQKATGSGGTGMIRSPLRQGFRRPVFPDRTYNSSGPSRTALVPGGSQEGAPWQIPRNAQMPPATACRRMARSIAAPTAKASPTGPKCFAAAATRAAT
jgi:hypothetical protein